MTTPAGRGHARSEGYLHDEDECLAMLVTECDDGYATCERTYVTFRLYSEAVDAEQLTHWLGVQTYDLFAPNVWQTARRIGTTKAGPDE